MKRKQSLEESGRLGQISSDYNKLLFSEHDVNEYFGKSTNPPGSFSGKGFSVGAVALGAEILRQAGIVGDVLSFGIAAAEAAEKRSKDDIKGSNQVWVEYIFETSGGFAGAALGAYGAIIFLKGKGGFWAPIIAAIAGGVAGGLAGKDLGTFVYKTYSDTIDPYFEKIYSGLQFKTPDFKTYTPDEITAPHAFVEASLEGFGYSREFSSNTDHEDILVGAKWSHLSGGGGDDVIFGWMPEFVKAGEQVDSEDPESAIADSQITMVLDGGAGNDLIITALGEKAITIGGAGRDWIFNTSKEGVIYGDTIDGLDPEKGAKVEDSKENSDNFWFWPGVTIKDAGHYDVLKFFGLPLTGGNIAAGGALAVAETSIGGYTGGGLAWAVFETTKAHGQGATGGLFWDNLVPFINYVYDINTNTMYVTNYIEALSGLFITGKTDMFRGTSKTDNPDTPEDETTNLTGFMRIDNFDLIATLLGALQQQSTSSSFGGNGYENYQGTLNMVFKQINPVAVVLDMLPPTAITFGIQAKYGSDLLIAGDGNDTILVYKGAAEQVNRRLIEGGDGNDVITSWGRGGEPPRLHFGIVSPAITERAA